MSLATVLQIEHPQPQLLASRKPASTGVGYARARPALRKLCLASQPQLLITAPDSSLAYSNRIL
jgi:hypothetical protein